MNIYNFSAGPAMLPPEVLLEAQEELLDWHGTGMSIMEQSHRGQNFISIVEQSKADMKTLLNIPDNYDILFLHGGARSQFTMVPMNLIQDTAAADYLVTGTWSQLAYDEASRFGSTEKLCQPHRHTIEATDQWKSLNPDASYLYYTDNETIQGLEFPSPPISGEVPLVSDMSSNLLSRTFDISQFGIVFACAQKNIGIAGVTLVIIRNDLLDRTPLKHTPVMFQYKLHAEANSLLNTAPTYPWYMASLVLQWVINQGGVAEMEERAAKKSELLYKTIDHSSLYVNHIDMAYRSRMNVVFQLKNESLTDLFLESAKQEGLFNLKGHRSVGGMRASIYNAMPLSGAVALSDFMNEFERTHG